MHVKLYFHLVDIYILLYVIYNVFYTASVLLKCVSDGACLE